MIEQESSASAVSDSKLDGVVGGKSSPVAQTATKVGHNPYHY